MAAGPAQRQVAEDGNVVVRGDGMLAAGAPGTGRHHRPPFGDARDAYIEEAAEDQPEDQSENDIDHLEIRTSLR
jgi:hypothetical protein